MTLLKRMRAARAAMGNFTPLLPAGRARAMLDAALVLWVAVWIYLGVSIGEQVNGLRQLSSTVTKVGVAVRTTGDAVSGLGSVPFVGGQIKDAGAQVKSAGESAIQSGRQSRNSVSSLSWMLALAIAVIPSVPVLGFYLPLRIAAVRERRVARRLAERCWDDPDFRRVLAERALVTLPYRRLAKLVPNPWDEFESGRLDALARAELARLGVTKATWRESVR
jgi:hypothetical protein